eukprot:SAG11_NODE_1365_length_5109_cov_2.411976_5_plen_87_part_00
MPPRCPCAAALSDPQLAAGNGTELKAIRERMASLIVENQKLGKAAAATNDVMMKTLEQYEAKEEELAHVREESSMKIEDLQVRLAH